MAVQEAVVSVTSVDAPRRDFLMFAMQFSYRLSARKVPKRYGQCSRWVRVVVVCLMYYSLHVYNDIRRDDHWGATRESQR